MNITYWLSDAWLLKTYNMLITDYTIITTMVVGGLLFVAKRLGWQWLVDLLQKVRWRRKL